jgi:hypothetical protein
MNEPWRLYDSRGLLHFAFLSQGVAYLKYTGGRYLGICMYGYL